MPVPVCRQTKDNGQVSACLFTEPKFIVDDTFLLDYSMFFGATLLDYYEASGDRETLEDLSKCAYRQMEIAGEQFDEKHLDEKWRRILGIQSTGLDGLKQTDC